MERYKLGDIDNERFYLLPKSLFLNPDYTGMSITAKVLYALLRDRMKLSERNQWADDNGEIFLLFTQEEIQSVLQISHPTCVKAMKQLQAYGLIDVIRQGVQRPNKVYIRKLKSFTLRCKKTLLHDVKKINANDTEMNETEMNETEKRKRAGKPASSPRATFTPPTLEEIRAYCQDRGNNIDPESFLDFYASKGWMVGRNKMRDWKAAVRTWERRDRERPAMRLTRRGTEQQRKEAAKNTVAELLAEFEQEERHG